jgi:RHS repeat-associated protein
MISNGNETSKTDSTGTTTYAWDYENRLTSVTLPGSGGTVSYGYDPLGRRIYKSSASGTSIYAYDVVNMVEEVSGAGAVVARYSQALNIDEPLAMLRSGATNYYEADGLSSVTSLSNTSGALANTYSYDSFGKPLTSSGTLVNSFRHAGRELDSEASLYYYRARYYDSSSGRFLSEDPVGFKGGQNFYNFVLNMPTNLIDPTGLWPWPWSNPGPPPTPQPPKPPPIYNPGVWGRGFERSNNCYSYACDILRRPGTNYGLLQPGVRHGLFPFPRLDCATVKAAAKSDGLKDPSDGTCPCNTHLVWLVVGQNVRQPGSQLPGRPDYHWYRQDVNGGWSSKHGQAPVGPQLPDIGAVVQEAYQWGYTDQCGSMCAPNQ